MYHGLKKNLDKQNISAVDQLWNKTRLYLEQCRGGTVKQSSFQNCLNSFSRLKSSGKDQPLI